MSGVSTSGFPEKLSVIEDIPKGVEISKDDNLFAGLNNSFDDDLNNEIFEYDDHHCKHDNKHDEHDDDSDNYYSFDEN